MLTPQEVSNHAFAKAVMGGYNMAMVDEFLDELTDDYTSLYKENAALKAKMKVLVDKVEEYRSTEDAMRAALLTAQKMADSMVAEAEEKKKSLLENAESEANRKIGALRDEVAQEERRLTAAKAETADFLARVRELYEREMKLLEELPEADLAPAAPLELAKPAADVSEIEKSIILEYATYDNCVIVGRCANFILKNRPNVLKVHIYAPYEARLNMSIEDLHLSKSEAKAMIDKVDEARSSYYLYHTGEMFDSTAYQDILLNSSMLSFDENVKLLCDIAKNRFPSLKKDS